MIRARILIVATEADQLDFLQSVVDRDLTNSSVDRASTAGAGVRMAQANRYHAILSDMDLPDMNGLDFLREVTKLQPYPATIMMVDAHTDLPLALDGGAFTCLCKPVSASTLTATLQRAVEFGQLHLRVDQFKQKLAALHKSHGANMRQLRLKILRGEARMKELSQWEEEQAGWSFALEDVCMGWSCETMLGYKLQTSKSNGSHAA